MRQRRWTWMMVAVLTAALIGVGPATAEENGEEEPAPCPLTPPEDAFDALCETVACLLVGQEVSYDHPVPIVVPPGAESGLGWDTDTHHKGFFESVSADYEQGIYVYRLTGFQDTTQCVEPVYGEPLPQPVLICIEALNPGPVHTDDSDSIRGILDACQGILYLDPDTLPLGP